MDCLTLPGSKPALYHFQPYSNLTHLTPTPILTHLTPNLTPATATCSI